MNKTKIVALGVWLALVGLIVLLAVGGNDGDPTAGVSSRIIGQRVPEIRGDTLDGGAYNIDNARGKWVAVNFFATWCPGCVAEHPELVKFNEQAKENGQAELVAIVFNDPADVVAEFFAENGGDWPVVQASTVAVDFQVSQIPETFLVAPSGVVTHRFQGEVTAELLWRAIANAEGDDG